MFCMVSGLGFRLKGGVLDGVGNGGIFIGFSLVGLFSKSL